MSTTGTAWSPDGGRSVAAIGRLRRQKGQLDPDHPPLCDSCAAKRYQRGERVSRTVFSRVVPIGLCVDCGAQVWRSS